MSSVYNNTVSASKKSFWAKTKQVLLAFVCHSAPVETRHVHEVKEKREETIQTENVNRISHDSGYTSLAEQERLHAAAEETRAAREQLREEERVRLEAQKKSREDYELDLEVQRQKEQSKRERIDKEEKMRQARVEAEANRRRLAKEAEEKRVQEKLRQSMLLMEEQNALVVAHQRMEVNRANAMHERMMAIMAAANAEVEKAAKRGC
ncbi:hypothetical protein YB2330_006191 [Saitoella coloradoensis]